MCRHTEKLGMIWSVQHKLVNAKIVTQRTSCTRTVDRFSARTAVRNNSLVNRPQPGRRVNIQTDRTRISSCEAKQWSLNFTTPTM